MGSAPYIPIEVLDLDSDNNGIVGLPDFLAFIATHGSSKGDPEYERQFDADFDDDIDDDDETIFEDTYTLNNDLGTIRDAIKTATIQKLTWPDNWVAHLTQLVNVDATIQKFTGRDGAAIPGWISIHRHLYTGDYVCFQFGVDTAVAAYKGLGYGCLLSAGSSTHLYIIFWIGGDWTDLNNWRILEPQNGAIFNATGWAPPLWQASTSYNVFQHVRPSVWNRKRYKCVTAGTSGSEEPTWNETINGTTNDGTVVWQCNWASMYHTKDIHFYDYKTTNIRAHQLRVDVIAETVSYGSTDAALSSPDNLEEPVPTIFDRTLGLPVTVVAPTVTTQAVTDIETTTATGHGNITDIGYENCDKRGICWNTSGNPTVAGNKSEQAGSFGTGAFSRQITGLIQGETYYVKAYAHNSEGYGYGNQVSFTHYMSTTIDVPLTSVNSTSEVPTPSLGITLSPYTVPIAYAVIPIPSFVVDRIFEAPTLNVDSQAPSPDWSQEVLLSPPVIAVDSEGKVPDFFRDRIFASPLVAINSATPTPETFDGVWVIIEPPVVKIDSGAVTVFPSNVAIDSEALLAWLGDADIHPPVVSLDSGALTPSFTGISITIQPPVVAIESGAILFLPPAVAIDSEGLTPTPGLDRIMSSPLVSVESSGISPTVALDRVFGVPLVLVDSQAPSPIFVLESLVDSPLVTIDGESLTVTFRLDRTSDIPVVQLGSEAPIPFETTVHHLTIIVPIATIEELGLVPALYLEFFRGITSFEGRNIGGFVGRDLKEFAGRRIK